MSEEQNYTDSELLNITEGIDDGLSVKEISVRHSIALNKVRDIVTDQGLVDGLQNRSYWIWDDDEDDELVVAWSNEDRPSLKEIAERHKRTVGAIQSRLKFLQKEGRIDIESKSNTGHRWSAEDTVKLVYLVENEESWSEIAEEMGRSVKAVQRKYRSMSAKRKNVKVKITCGNVTATLTIPGDGPITVTIPSKKWSTQIE